MTDRGPFTTHLRARMAAAGERHDAARRALLPASSAPADGDHVSPPEFADARVREGTGRGWDEWRALIDDAGLRTAGHTAIAAWVAGEHGVEGWWAQAVTVSYERIVGLRLPGQMADGTFTANVGRTFGETVDLDLSTLRTLVIDAHDDLFPAMATELRSRPTSKSLRVSFVEGSALITPETTPAGRLKVTVAHEKLPSPDAAELWKVYWRAWFDALSDG